MSAVIDHGQFRAFQDVRKLAKQAGVPREQAMREARRQVSEGGDVRVVAFELSCLRMGVQPPPRSPEAA